MDALSYDFFPSEIWTISHKIPFVSKLKVIDMVYQLLNNTCISGFLHVIFFCHMYKWWLWFMVLMFIIKVENSNKPNNTFKLLQQRTENLDSMFSKLN